MPHQLTRLLAAMTPAEEAELEIFAAFLLARRQLRMPRLVTDDPSAEELLELVAASGSFEWLGSEEEDVYSLADGEAVRWPDP